MKGPFGENLVFKKDFSLEDIKSFDSIVLFVDDKLKSKIDTKITDKFPVKFLKGGESLKTLEQYQKNLEFLFKNKAHKKTLIVAVGGGSLLDSISFLASTYLRGVKLALVPTTWLSCIDASVGGKTALNWNDRKNQIGSFYPPQAIYFCENLISAESLKDAQGEVVKTLLLNHRQKWAKDLTSKSKITFSVLKKFISYKTKVVKSDPYEKNKKRMVLNLGHTLGHVLELSKGLSHGESVLYGLKFALEWSLHKKLLSKSCYEKASKALFDVNLKDMPVSLTFLKKHLGSDKKSEGEKLNFIFLTDKDPVVKKISFDALLLEYKRQLKSRV